MNADSGLAGRNVPVNGACSFVTLWIEAVAESSSTVWQKLLPLLSGPPAVSSSVTAVPPGEVSLSATSPTHV
jgi:hypothetical protein